MSPRAFSDLVREMKRQASGCYQQPTDAARFLEKQARWIREGVLSVPGGHSKEDFLEALLIAANQLRDEE